jgi:hypothetical protein
MVTTYIAGGVGLLILGPLLARLVAKIRSTVADRRKYATKTVIAEYTAPQCLSAAELGYIVDGIFGANELLATIATLYAKDAIAITPRKHDLTITAKELGNNPPLDDQESTLLGYLASMPERQLRWSQLPDIFSEITGMQPDCEAAVVDSLAGKGLLSRHGYRQMLFHKRFVSGFLAGVSTIAIALPLFVWIHNTFRAENVSMGEGFAALDFDVSLLITGLAVLAVGGAWYMYWNLLIYLYMQRDGMPMGATKQLQSLWPEVAGFQLFVRETEYVRLQHDQNSRDPALPYCLALGLDPGFERSLQK